MERRTIVVSAAVVAAMLIPVSGQAQDAAGGSSAVGPPVISEAPSHGFGYRSPFERQQLQLGDKVGADAETDRTEQASEAAAPSPACPAICLTENFTTMQDPDGASPGDPTGAAGDNHVVAAVNVSMAIYDRTGGEEYAPTLLGDTVASPLPFFFDPKVVYDQYSDMYILVFVGVKDSTQESEIYIVSIPDATATDDSTWCAREVVGDQSPGNGKQWADYPGLGYSADRVFVSANMFNFGPGGEGSQVIAFDKAGLYDCSDPLTSDVFTTDDMVLGNGKKIWTLQPATMEGTGTSKHYGMATLYNCPGGNCKGNRIVLGRFNGDKFIAKKLKVKDFVMAWGTQKGTPLSQNEAYWDVGDLRFTNSFYDADTNKIYASHAVLKNVDKSDGWEESVARWYELTPGSPMKNTSIDRSGNVATSKKDAGWPVVATDSNDNLWVNYSRASGAKGAKEYLGAWIAVVHPGDKAPAEIVQFATGSSLYAPFPGPERWGDYNAINRDPLDGTRMWIVNQRAATLNKFQQVVAAVTDV